MIIKEIKSKEIISKSNLPESDYVINPYVGCCHSCIYCYARFMKRFTNHEEELGQFVDIKINSPELIPDSDKKYKGKSFFISSVTDPYLQLERKYKLTKQILEKLVDWDIKIGIQTKTDLVLRDLDIIKKLKNCEVGLTITTTDDNFRKEIEPYTASIEDRVAALKELKKNGIRTYVFIGPIMPYFCDWKSIVNMTKDYADFYYFENLNVKGSIWFSIEEWLKNKHPEYLKKYIEIYDTDNDYWINIKKEIEEFCSKNNIIGKVCFHAPKTK